MRGVEMHSYYMLEELGSERQQEIFRNATSKRPDWWPARRSGQLRGHSMVVASATIVTS